MRMLKLSFWGVVSGILFLSVSVAPAIEWQDVIVGDAMPGWEPKHLATEESWVIHDGVLMCTGKARERKGTVEDWGVAWIGTKKKYTDFALEFEFKLSPGGNSGVFIRVPEKGHPTFDGMEIQILDDYSPEYEKCLPGQLCGALYKIADPAKKAVKPAGTWNQMRVTCQGDHIVAILNGEKVVDADGKTYPEILKRSPCGPIGLQNHGTPIWFRNIRLADLSDKNATHPSSGD